MNSAVEIAEATTFEQIDDVRGLFRSYQAQHPIPSRFPDKEWQELPGVYARPSGALLLATINLQPAGCVGLRPFTLENTCEMKRLYVSPAFRGEHVGQALIENLVVTARTLGYARMRLDTHVATMGPAMALYRRLGFVEVPPYPTPAVEGLCYMELRL
jgi:GNAT superfamily N-acetyltransferase